MTLKNKVRVLIVDDSGLVREVLRQGLGGDPSIEVVGVAGDPFEARELLVKLRPDVMTLDVEMPKMTGLEFLKKLMPQFPVPVVMVSSLTEKGKQITLDALSFGAVDFVAKPKADVASGLNAMMMELRAKVKIAAIANVSHWKKGREELHQSVRQTLAPEAEKGKFDLIAIGASTGGTEAIAAVLKDLPANLPPVVIVQHMPQGFTKLFADRMNTITQLDVAEAKSGDMLSRGKCFIAPGGLQLEVVRSGSLYRLDVKESGLVNGHAPSVEVMMRAVAKAAGARAIGVMLTGMGGDGADGMKAMRDAGARTMAQDEATCVVFGMPKVAWEKGGAQELVALPKISGKVISILKGDG